AVRRVRVRRGVVVEQHDVLRHPDRLEAALLGLAPERAHDLRRRVGGAQRYEESDVHAAPLLREPGGIPRAAPACACAGPGRKRASTAGSRTGSGRPGGTATVRTETTTGYVAAMTVLDWLL